MKSEFNPHDWLPNDNRSDIDLVVSRIEAAHTDITGSYADWLNLGFALTDELGERGRDYFHRISRFYSKYSHSDCNRQYDQCLKAKGHGITIKTLFHLAKQAGIDVSCPSKEAVFTTAERTTAVLKEKKEEFTPEPKRVDLPTLPDSVYAALPDFLKKVVAPCLTNEERDIMLLGSIATLSCCFPKVYGIYDNKRVFTNLFLFITAQASAGKGNLVLCKRLVNPIHWELRKLTHTMKAQYETEMREYNLMKMKDFTIEKPTKPAEKMLFIPANNSTTGVFQLLSDNEGKGLIFETEGDTLAQAFKSDYGNYSDGFRKAFHHETISYYRRTDHEFVEIDTPCLSAVLTGTPKQIASLIPSAENGLFSRFIFYYMNMKALWKDVLASNDEDGLEGYYNTRGQEFLPLYNALIANPAIKFCVTDQQHEQFNVFFTQLQDKYLILQGMDYMATIRRLGLIAYRIAMIFTTLRILETGDFSEKQVCSDVDFQAALSMVRILVRHSSHVYSELPEDVQTTTHKNKKEQFLDKLPEKFTRQDYIELAKSLSIPDKTADRYINMFCDKGLIFREQHGVYIKLTLADG